MPTSRPTRRNHADRYRFTISPRLFRGKSSIETNNSTQNARIYDHFICASVSHSFRFTEFAFACTETLVSLLVREEMIRARFHAKSLFARTSGANDAEDRIYEDYVGIRPHCELPRALGLGGRLGYCIEREGRNESCTRELVFVGTRTRESIVPDRRAKSKRGQSG